MVAPSYGIVDMSAGAGHGDLVAALAVGDLQGVASRANLVGVKVLNANGYATILGEWENWQQIIADVNNKGLRGRAVITVSSCTYPLHLR